MICSAFTERSLRNIATSGAAAILAANSGAPNAWAAVLAKYCDLGSCDVSMLPILKFENLNL